MTEPDPKMLDLHALFDAEDSRFLEVLRTTFSPALLATFAERWKRDLRPWAREQILAYLDEPLDAPGHEVVVKRLFKQAEAQRDVPLMAAFMVAFDRLVRRNRKVVNTIDWNTRSVVPIERLEVRYRALPHIRRDVEGDWILRQMSDGRLFSHGTRYYLRRRAWRFFRRMGHQQPEAYPGAVAQALMLYQDEDLAAGEDLLECWGLVSACYRGSPELAFHANRVCIAPAGQLARLVAAPAFEAHWVAPKQMPRLLTLATEAPSRLVRQWALELLERHHGAAMAALPLATVLDLLDTADPDAQPLVCELLAARSDLDTLTPAQWTALLQTRHVAAMQTLCRLAEKYLTPNRTTLAACVDLACRTAAPLALLGLKLLRRWQISTDAERDAIAQLAHCRCAAHAEDITDWALTQLGGDAEYRGDRVIGFFDSPLVGARAAAWRWLTPDSPGYGDPVLWARLTESPYDDVRFRLIDALQQRAALPGADDDKLSSLWSAVLLSVEGGSVQKRRAVAQVADAMMAEPARAHVLLPVLAVAIRSVRLTERRSALAALAAVLAAHPHLRDVIEALLPELRTPACDGAAT